MFTLQVLYNTILSQNIKFTLTLNNNNKNNPFRHFLTKFVFENNTFINRNKTFNCDTRIEPIAIFAKISSEKHRILYIDLLIKNDDFLSLSSELNN